MLDLGTLVLASVFVTALVGALLMFSWWQNRSMEALAWWGASLIVCVISMSLLVGRGMLPGWLSIGAANAVLGVTFGLFWAGFRVFGRHGRPAVVAVIAGGLVWLAACGIPGFYKSFGLRVALSSAIAATYVLLACWELWRGRHERLGSTLPLQVILVGHALVMLSRYPTLVLTGHVREATVFTVPWVAIHAFEALLFTITCAFLLLCLTKERVEAEQRSIAARDPLTGLLNRRSFLEHGRVVLDRCRRDGSDCTLLLMDIDLFKTVNDRFGHAVGDEVLCRFARTALGALPTGSLVARLGGEEFVCLLPTDRDTAQAAAERVRYGFATTRFETEDEAFGATVSIGLAATREAGHILDALLAAADIGLYRAKTLGRNRVEDAAPEACGSPIFEPRLALAA